MPIEMHCHNDLAGRQLRFSYEGVRACIDAGVIMHQYYY